MTDQSLVQEQLETIPSNLKNKPVSPREPINSKIHFLILIFLLLILITGISILIKPLIGQVNQSQPKVTTEKQLPNITLIPTVAISQAPVEPKEWVLQRKGDEKKEVLTIPVENKYLVEINEEIPKIVRWKDFLFFSNFKERNDGSNEVLVKSYNLDSGETEIVFSQDEFKNNFGDTWQPTELSDIKLFNDMLFFSLAGEGSIAAYPERGGIFAFDLPALQKPVIISKMDSATFISLKNYNFIYRALGAECGGTESYSLLDIQSKKINGVINSNVGCAEGDEYVDIDKRDRMILSFHSGGSSELPYESVVAVPLSNPEIKTEIIAKQNMPGVIKTLFYSEGQDQLLLLGKTAYVYDFSSGVINKIVDIPDDWEIPRRTRWMGQVWPNYIWKEDIVCIPVGHYDRPKDGNEINLRTKEIKKESDFCKSIYSSPTPAPQNKLKTYLDNLNLPPNYELVLR